VSPNRALRRALPIFVAALAALGLASSAFACQVLATLAVSPTSGPAGTTITATGENYSGSTTSGPIEIRLDSRTAPVLASVPAGSRSLKVTFDLPAGTKVGYHTVIATQMLSNGNPVAGTPGRASFKVTAPSTSASSVAPTSWAQAPVALAGVGLMVLSLVSARRRSARRSATIS
jgi:hypothetical protein